MSSLQQANPTFSNNTICNIFFISKSTHHPTNKKPHESAKGGQAGGGDGKSFWRNLFNCSNGELRLFTLDFKRKIFINLLPNYGLAKR